MHLVADILDKQVVDSKKTKCGKVDGIVIVVRQGKPPRVAAIEIGNAVTARRLARWTERLKLARERIAWSKVKKADIEVELDFDASDSSMLKTERWLRDHIVSKVPF